MTGEAVGMDFPTPRGEQWPPRIPRPCPVPHAVLHDDGCVEAALFGVVDDAFDTVLDGVLAGVIGVVADIVEGRACFALIDVADKCEADILAQKLLNS